MKNMKKILVILLALCMIFSLAGCGDSGGKSTSDRKSSRDKDEDDDEDEEVLEIDGEEVSYKAFKKQMKRLMELAEANGGAGTTMIGYDGDGYDITEDDDLEDLYEALVENKGKGKFSITEGEEISYEELVKLIESFDDADPDPSSMEGDVPKGGGGGEIDGLWQGTYTKFVGDDRHNDPEIFDLVLNADGSGTTTGTAWRSPWPGLWRGISFP